MDKLESKVNYLRNFLIIKAFNIIKRLNHRKKLKKAAAELISL